MKKITVSAFLWVPPVVQGLVRDLRVHWALEEAGRPCEVHLIGGNDQPSDAYRALQPFGQVPAYVEDGLTLFESGAVVMHITEGSEALMSTEPDERARTKRWTFAALNTIEPLTRSGQHSTPTSAAAGLRPHSRRRSPTSSRVRGARAASGLVAADRPDIGERRFDGGSRTVQKRRSLTKRRAAGFAP